MKGCHGVDNELALATALLLMSCLNNAIDNQINFQHCPFESHSEGLHPFDEVLLSISCKKVNLPCS